MIEFAVVIGPKTVMPQWLLVVFLNKEKLSDLIESLEYEDTLKDNL